MSERYYLTDGGHVLISGATGAKEGYGGKTVTANWWFSEAVRKGWHDMGIFINPKGHVATIRKPRTGLNHAHRESTS
jgi:hypothetical protein